MSMLTNSPSAYTVLRLEARRSVAVLVELLKADDAPIDLTGSTVRLVLANPPHKGGTVLLTKVATAVDLLKGLVRLDVQANEVDLAEGEYPYSITLTSPESFSSTIIKGSVEILANPDPAEATHTLVAPPLSLTVQLLEQNKITVTVNHVPPPVFQLAVDQAAAEAAINAVLPAKIATDGDPVHEALEVYATRAGAEVLTNKTFALGSNSLSGTKAQFDTALTDADFATLAAAETLLNKVIALGSNTISGTKAQFDTALTDADFATLAGVETFTNKTLTSPTLTNPVITESAAWTSFVFNTPNLPLNAGATFARYKKIGRFVHAQFNAVASGAAGGTILIDLPVTAAIYNVGADNNMMIGIVMVTDTGTRSWPMWIYRTSGTQAQLFMFDGSDIGGPSKPMVWAAGDTLSGSFTYESAA